ncbi:hypothetical protein R5R35_007141 [Gryllus longicercus]|uniref:Accessory gland protein n=1 Tax=Gryllus longicercus TaxID=2509291 RepID=A0AAN9Z0V5_9ORTH
MAHIWAKVALLLALLGVARAVPVARGVTIKSDVLYFPDQVDYIRASRGKCAGAEELYWAGDGRCYAEGAQGPCGFEFRLVWDERQLRPRCERDNSLLGRR